jgi:multiple sugar transport system permease protein
VDLIAGWTLILPQSLGFLVFVALPILGVFGISLYEWNIITGRIVPVGLDNYTERLPADVRTPEVMRNTLVFILGFMPVTVVGGLLLAVLTDRPKPGMQAYRAVFFLPVVISLAAWAMVWRIVLQPEGPLNATLAFLDIDGPNWLADPEFALAAVTGVGVLKTVGFTMILFHAALQNVPSEVIEASRVDGAGPVARFFFITFPLIAPFTFLVVILVTISSFKTFALFHVLTGGGPGDATRVLSYYIYDMAFRFFGLGYAATLSVILFLAILLLTVLQFVNRRRWMHEDP